MFGVFILFFSEFLFMLFLTCGKSFICYNCNFFIFYFLLPAFCSFRFVVVVGSALCRVASVDDFVQ